LKKRLCSLAIKARDSPCTREGRRGETERQNRGDFRTEKGTKNQKKKENQQGIKHRKKANRQGRNRQEKGRTMEIENERRADNTGD
jgi:hypothetical protein